MTEQLKLVVLQKVSCIKVAQLLHRLLSRLTKPAKAPDGPAVLIMDLQQALPTPHISTGKVFYSRQLWTYNFGIHWCNDDSAVMCVWPQFVASRGADEIGFCVLKAVQNKVAQDKRKLIIWSDCCPGQNKNFKMFCLWLYLVECERFDQIEHKFFVLGHSMMDSDRDLASSNKKKKRKTTFIYTHEFWEKLIRNTWVRKPFTVLSMQTNDMLDLPPIEKLFVKPKKLENGDDLALRKLSAVTVRRAYPGKLFVSYNFSRN